MALPTEAWRGAEIRRRSTENSYVNLPRPCFVMLLNYENALAFSEPSPPFALSFQRFINSCNRTACIRHQYRKTSVLSCHRCLINTGACITILITAVIYGFRNKLECLNLKGLPGTNTLAYYGNRKLQAPGVEKMNNI